MKDEELAKEYEEKAEYIEVDDYGKKRYDSMDIQQAFLAGLKVGRQDEQITKAKKIIKELARVAYADFTDGDYSNELSKVLEQAERFLSEESK